MKNKKQKLEAYEKKQYELDELLKSIVSYLLNTVIYYFSQLVKIDFHKLSATIVPFG